MSASVVRIVRYRLKGGPGEALDRANLIEGLGLEGNLHQGGERQVCLLDARARRWMEAQAVQGLCFHRFKENLLIEGLPFDRLSAGTLLLAGDALLLVSGRGKRCFDGCQLFAAGAECLLAGGAVFAAVLRGGAVRAGDPVTLDSPDCKFTHPL